MHGLAIALQLCKHGRSAAYKTYGRLPRDFFCQRDQLPAPCAEGRFERIPRQCQDETRIKASSSRCCKHSIMFTRCDERQEVSRVQGVLLDRCLDLEYLRMVISEGSCPQRTKRETRALLSGAGQGIGKLEHQLARGRDIDIKFHIHQQGNALLQLLLYLPGCKMDESDIKVGIAQQWKNNLVHARC